MAGSGGGGGSGAGGSGVDAHAPDAVTDAPASNGDAPTTADDLCRTAIFARCQRLAACGGGVSPDGSCTAASAACPDYLFNQASTRTVAGIAACLDELGQQPCSDIDLGVLPSCLSPGTRPAGAACAYSSNCASGGCSGRGMVCGTCAAEPAATGQSCASAGCRAGDFCHPASKLCTSGSTIVHAAQDQPCDLAAQPSVGCAGDLHCIAPTGQTAGTCQPLPLLDVGQPCYQVPGVCRAGLECFTNINGSTTTSECVALPGDPACGSAPCDSTTFCKSGDGGRYCAPRAAVGDVCAGDGGAVIAQCVSGAFCFGGGVCGKYGMRGDPCSDAQPCASYLVCTNGRCAPLGTEGCAPMAGDAGGG